MRVVQSAPSKGTEASTLFAGTRAVKHEPALGVPHHAGDSQESSTMPQRPTVNTRISEASNAKQVRQREAEEDRGLIAKAQQGDKGAFRQLVERHQRRAFALALSLVRDESDARELVQEAFLRVYKSLPTFQGSSSFFTWLYRIITNLSIDLIRKPGRQLPDLDETRFELDDSQEAEFSFVGHIDGADPADVMRRREIANRLMAAMDELPPYHRSVIVMREVEGLSYEEMASTMGVSKGTIMSRLFHARRKLQQALADYYEEQVGRLPQGVREDSAREGSEGEDKP
ncbi:MAG: sigma-70 family RNA polymerase sigma factor [Polyangiaceae bacterium]|nr:sigma-70 family RNA polymerase sigma factor [Polyangiaceae bacterium]